MHPLLPCCACLGLAGSAVLLLFWFNWPCLLASSAYTRSHVQRQPLPPPPACFRRTTQALLLNLDVLCRPLPASKRVDSLPLLFTPFPSQPVTCRTAEELFLHLGGSIGYWRGDLKGLMEDIGALVC